MYSAFDASHHSPIGRHVRLPLLNPSTGMNVPDKLALLRNGYVIRTQKRLLLAVAERYEQIATIAEAGRLGFAQPSRP